MYVRPETLKPCDIAFENHTNFILIVHVEDLGDKVVYHVFDSVEKREEWEKENR